MVYLSLDGNFSDKIFKPNYIRYTSINKLIITTKQPRFETKLVYNVDNL